MTRKVLGIAAAVALILGAAFHTVGWALVGSQQFAGPHYSFLRSLWFFPAIDWLVVAAIWLQGARGVVPAVTMRIAAIIPLVVAINAFVLMGPAFVGAWILLIASALALWASTAKT